MSSNIANNNPWPTGREIILALAFALLITAIDILFSMQVGLLAYPPYYDGISYVLSAKKLFYALKQLSDNPGSLEIYKLIVDRINPPVLWQALIVLSFFVLGEGEWQAYTVRFWPIFLFFLITLWVVRRRGGTQIAIFALLFTSLLPTISVGIRSISWEYFTGKASFFLEWYLADLRPDLLFTALLLWSIVPLIEQVHNLNKWTLLISGFSGGLAVLAKTSAAPILFFAWGLSILYIFIANRSKLSSTVRLVCLWGLSPLAIVIVPYAIAGGAKWIINYYYINLAIGVYAIPNSTFLSEIVYYWKLFPFHMGHLEGWTALGIGLLSLVIAWKKKLRDNSLLAYLGLSAALYILISITPNKNYFVGLPCYLLLWIFSCATLASIVKMCNIRNRTVTVTIVLFLSLYTITVILSSLYALQNWPAEVRYAAKKNREATLQIAGVLKQVLTSNDCFTYLPAFGYPATLQYYMMDHEGVYPESTRIDVFPPVKPEQFVKDEVSKCKAILIYNEDVQEVSKFSFFPSARWPYLRAISEWVKQPNSPYVLYKSYNISAIPFPYYSTTSYYLGDQRLFTIELYIKN